MWPFWLMFLLPAGLALSQGRAYGPLPARWPAIWRIAFVILMLFIGLRFEVGGDWLQYIWHLHKAEIETLFQSLSQSDPAYKVLNWLAVRTGAGIWLVNLLSAGIFSYGLVAFCRTLPRPWLALAVAVPYLVTVVAMGYTRQGIAIGLILLALEAMKDKRLYRYFALMALAALFHKTAIILLPLVAFSNASNRWWRYFLTLIILALGYWLLIRDSVEYFVDGYIDAEYESQGAAIRVAMNAVPALAFLLFERRFRLPPDERMFWRIMALGALVFIGFLLVMPSSTAVDRLALYWIPLQMYVFARLPDALGRAGGKNSGWVLVVVVYYALILAVWLNFASHAQYWLPYQFYPWVWFWDLPSKY